MTTRQLRPRRNLPRTRSLPKVPRSWKLRNGSDVEYYVYVGLLRTGRREPFDFIYQGSLGGTQGTLGSARPDFVLTNPLMAIDVQSRYHHSRNVDQVSHDQRVRMFVEGQGIPIAFISADQARLDADNAVKRVIASQGINTGPLGVLV